MASGSTVAVYSAIAGNSLVMIAKLLAFLFTGSGAMFSEAIHSFADVSNQILLAIGISRSKKKADRVQPYGYARERFIWALISAVGIFFVGCGVTVYHGVSLLHHTTSLEHVDAALIVLAFSFVVESATLFVAVKVIQNAAKDLNTTFWDYIRRGHDPMPVAVLLEDIIAVLGVLVAACGLLLSRLTGNVIWDAIATLVIGLMLGIVAVFLIWRNKAMLVGQAMSPRHRKRILQLLDDDPVVARIKDVKTVVLGVDNLRFKAEIEFDTDHIVRSYLNTVDIDAIYSKVSGQGELESFLHSYAHQIVTLLGDEVDRLEQMIRGAIPQIKHIDLETD